MFERPPVIFIDIDGTFSPLDSARGYADALSMTARPPQENVDAICELAERGAVPIICTGRPKCALHPDILEAPFAGMVTLNGAYVELGGRTLADRHFGRDEFRTILEALLRCHIHAHLEATDAQLALEYEGGPRRLEGLPAAYSLEDVLAACPRLDFAEAAVFDDEWGRAAGEPALEKLRLSGISGGESTFTAGGISKRLGIERVLETIGEYGKTYGLGDSANDRAMWDAVDVAVVMGGADPALREEADLVAPPAEEAGVTGALRELGLIG